MTDFSAADITLANDIERAILKYQANGGATERVIEILQLAIAKLSPQDTAAAQPIIVVTAAKPAAAAASPVRLARKAASTTRVRRTNLFATFKLSDGRSIGKVHYTELPAIARKSAVNSSVCWAIYNHVQPTNQNTKVEDLVSEDFLRQAIDNAKGVRDDLSAA